MNRAGYAAASGGGRLLLRTPAIATGSPASLLLYDTDEGGLIAIVGDHDWLGAASQEAASRSIRLASPGIAGDLARVAASLWARGGRPETGDRWRHLASASGERAARLAALGKGSSGDVAVDLVVDQEHVALEPGGDELVIGRVADSPDGEQGSVVGLSIRLSGSGVDAARARIAAGAEQPGDPGTGG